MQYEDPAPAPRQWRARGVVVLAGLAQGAAVYLGKTEPAWLTEPLREALVVAVLAGSLLLQMTWPRSGDRGAMLRSLGIAVLLGLEIGWAHHWAATMWHEADAPPVALLQGLAILLSLPLLQGFVADGLRLPAYARLFGRFVDAALTLLIALVSLGLYLMLRSLWAELFDRLGLQAIKDLLSGDAFASFTDATAWTLGILVMRESSGILDRLLRLCTMLARGLLPVVVAIGVSFLLALPFTGLDPLWEQGGSGLLLAIAGFAVLFINGVYQTGDDQFPAWQRRLVEAAILVFAASSGLAVYGTALRVEQHGLTPDRVLLLVSVVITASIAGGYLVAMIPGRRSWLSLLGLVNTLALPVIAIALLAIVSPALDPVGTSATDQFRRLAGGVVPAAEFDYGYLKFRLGKPGRALEEALVELESSHPEGGVIRKQLDALRRFDSYWEWAQYQRDKNPKRLADVPRVMPWQVGPFANKEAAREAVEAQREALWGAEIAERIGSGARHVFGPFAVRGRTIWRSGPLPRLYVVLDGWASFYRRTGSEDVAVPNRGGSGAGRVLRVEPGELTVIRTSEPLALLIVELEPAS